MWIRKVIFRNCQSLRNVEYEMTPGLNIILAPDNDGNSTGKSVFFKCLKTAIGAEFFDINELVHLISYGEKVASSLFELSDGSAGGFLVTPRKITYLYRPDSASSLEKLTAPHPLFLQNMSVIMDEKTKFVLNILDLDQELLFVNSREDTNFSILKLVSDNEAVEELIPAIEEKTADMTAFRKRAMATNISLHERLGAMKRHDISAMERSVSYATALVPLYEVIVDIMSLLQDITPLMQNDYEKGESLLNIYESVIALLDALKEVIYAPKKEYKKAAQLLDVFGILMKIVSICQTIELMPEKDFVRCNSILSLYESVQSAQSAIRSVHPQLSQNWEQAESLQGLYEVYYDLSSFLSILPDTCVKLSDACALLDRTQNELREFSQQVDCPIKGEVYFFEEGCLQVTGEDCNNSSSHCSNKVE